MPEPPTMKYRPLGRTGLRVSLAGLGTGGPSRIGARTHGDEAQSIKVVRHALDLGINLFDTAPTYDASEALLGRALAGVPRDTYLLATKARPANKGVVVDPEEVIQSCERSLQRLQTDRIDLLQLHAVTV